MARTLYDVSLYSLFIEKFIVLKATHNGISHNNTESQKHPVNLDARQNTDNIKDTLFQ